MPRVARTRSKRDVLLQEATASFNQFFLKLEEEYELTYGEMFKMLGERVARIARDLADDEAEDVDA